MARRGVGAHPHGEARERAVAKHVGLAEEAGRVVVDGELGRPPVRVTAGRRLELVAVDLAEGQGGAQRVEQGTHVARRLGAVGQAVASSIRQSCST